MSNFPKELFVVEDQGKDETWYWAHTTMGKGAEVDEAKEMGIYQLVKVVKVTAELRIEDL